MHLIVNSKRVRDEVQKRLPKEWGEEEVAQLTEMWENVKNDDDPVDLIYAGLRIKRPKPKIKEKLLELGLAKDPKELRKKRTKKSKSKSDGLPKASWETRSESEQSLSSSNEQDSSDTESTGRHSGPANRANKKITKKKNKKRQPTITYTDAQLSGFLKDVIDNDMRESLEWIKESLEEALEDRDEESADGIPLVPITDYSSAAMDSQTFMRFLRACGIEPPSNEQEAYWRIPSTMLSSTIRKRCDLIAKALAGDFVIQEPVTTEKDIEDSTSESDDDETQRDIDKIKSMFKQKSKLQNKSQAQASIVLNSSSDEDIERSLIKKKSLIVEKDEERTDGKKKERERTNTSKVRRGKLNSSRIKSMVDSSDSEMEIETTKISGEDNDEVKRIRSENSDTDEPVLKKRRVIIDSEDDEEKKEEESDFDKLLKSSKPKQTHINISDDENNGDDINEPRKSRQSRKIISDDDED